MLQWIFYPLVTFVSLALNGNAPLCRRPQSDSMRRAGEHGAFITPPSQVSDNVSRTDLSGG